MAVPEPYENEDLSEYPVGSLKTRQRMKKLIDEHTVELAGRKWVDAQFSAVDAHRLHPVRQRD